MKDYKFFPQEEEVEEEKAVEVEETVSAKPSIKKAPAKKMGMVIAKNGLRLRAKASSAAVILETLSASTEVEILSTKGKWYEVQVNGHVGYVDSKYVEVK